MTAEAVGAVNRQVVPADAVAIAERLCHLYVDEKSAGRETGAPTGFALAVARILCAAQQWDAACRLARAAADDAVASGQLAPWSELLALGVQAAREAGRREDLRYFLRRQHTDALVRNDTAAAAGILLLLAELARSVPAPPPRVSERGPIDCAASPGRCLASPGCIRLRNPIIPSSRHLLSTLRQTNHPG